MPNYSTPSRGFPRSILPSVSPYESGVFGSLPPAPAFRSGSLGTPPVSGAVKSGVLGVFGTPPPSGAFRSGSLGILGAPPPSGAIKSGVLGSLGVPPPAGAVKSGSLGVFGEAFSGLGAGASIMPEYRPIGFGDVTVMPKLTVAVAGLGALAVIWWAMRRRHA